MFTDPKEWCVKKAAIVAERRAELVDTADLVPHGNWVVIKVHSAPMCAEYKGFIAGQSQAVMGHEAAGEVVAATEAARVRVGNRVVAMPLAESANSAVLATTFIVRRRLRAAAMQDQSRAATRWRNSSSSPTGFCCRYPMTCLTNALHSPVVR